jgi:hypothetical protein
MLFCSGLGGAGLCVVLSLMYPGFSSVDCLILFEVPGLEVCGVESLPASELMLLFTLVPGVGDCGFVVLAPLTTPFRVGIWLADELGVSPSDERMSRCAAGSALGFGFFCFDLKRKLIFSSPFGRYSWRLVERLF